MQVSATLIAAQQAAREARARLQVPQAQANFAAALEKTTGFSALPLKQVAAPAAPVAQVCFGVVAGARAGRAAAALTPRAASSARVAAALEMSAWRAMCSINSDLFTKEPPLENTLAIV